MTQQTVSQTLKRWQLELAGLGADDTPRYPQQDRLC